jgi:hypothetical protein
MICSKCAIDKPENEYRWRNRAKSIRRKQCKECFRGYDTAHYRRSATRRADTKERSITHRKKMRSIVLEYLVTHNCVDCGEDDPVVLEFDHRDRLTKTAAISNLIENGSVTALLVEIDKCDIRCANCHRRRTAIQFGWAKLPRKPNGEAFGCNPKQDVRFVSEAPNKSDKWWCEGAGEPGRL